MLKSLQSIRSVQTRDLMASLEAIKVKPLNMLLALGGVLLVAYITVAASFVMEKREQSDLTQQIEAGGGTLSGVGDSQQLVAELEDRLSFANTTLDNLEQALPPVLDSTAIVKNLLDYAGRNHVSIRQMTALPAIQVGLEDEQKSATYTVLRYTLVVDGEFANLLAFLSALEAGNAHTAALGDAGITDVGAGKEMVIGVTFYAKPEGAPAETAPGTMPAPGG